MNDIMRGKIEACIELSDGDAKTFRKIAMKVTGLTTIGFNSIESLNKAYRMLDDGRSINDTIHCCLYN